MNSRYFVRSFLPGVILLALPYPVRAFEPERASTPPSFSDVRVLRVDGVRSRSLVRTDPIEAMLARGETLRPETDEPVTLLSGEKVQWAAAEFDAAGQLRHESLANGYVSAVVRSDRRQAVLLRASGHSHVIVNGRTRPGDPYGYGFVTLPVMLEKGDNSFLFRCQRGSLSSTLEMPTSDLIILKQDTTLPDVVIVESARLHAAVVVLNASDAWLNGVRLSSVCGIDEDVGEKSLSEPYVIPPMMAMKLGFSFVPPAEMGEAKTLKVRVAVEHAGGKGIGEDFDVRVRTKSESRRRTFVSGIDGSVQYYTVQPRPVGDGGIDQRASEPAALVLSLHGASVESQRQAEAYRPKDWADIVAPTNRRPFGFDWEDWGRRDAMEVLAEARRILNPDPNRIYLTGHSMGGHGTWQLGVHFPGTFAAIAPSAGWVSFYSYAGASDRADEDPVLAVLRRAANASDTLGLKSNLLHYGIYVLHGDRDDNVPVSEARHMREVLGAMHPNFAYYERPGAGHWWGDECMDWPPLFDFLKGVVRAPSPTVIKIDFATMSPAISDRCDWVSIVQQSEWMRPSEMSVTFDRAAGRIEGATKNVASVELDLDEAYGDAKDRPEKVQVVLDGQEAVEVSSAETAALRRVDGRWAPVGKRSAAEKGPERAGPFKTAFDHKVLLVVGTGGNDEENGWALNKARYDSEQFWYQGNGRLQIIRDADFNSDSTRDRSVILYGNSVTNSAWSKVLAKDYPIRVNRKSVSIGDRKMTGSDLAMFAVYPRSGSDVASVGIIAGTQLEGSRTLDRLPIFLSGVGIPDWVVLSARLYRDGAPGVRAAGFFDTAWRYAPAQSVWRVED